MSDKEQEIVPKENNPGNDGDKETDKKKSEGLIVAIISALSRTAGYPVSL